MSKYGYQDRHDTKRWITVERSVKDDGSDVVEFAIESRYDDDEIEWSSEITIGAQHIPGMCVALMPKHIRKIVGDYYLRVKIDDALNNGRRLGTDYPVDVIEFMNTNRDAMSSLARKIATFICESN